MKKNNGGIIILVIVLGFGLIRYLSHNGSGGSGSYSTANAQTGSSHDGATNTNLAPDFTLQTLDGRSISLAEYRGKKPVVLDFWASWCPNCRRDMPRLNGFYEKYKDQVEVIGVNLHEDPSTVSDFIASKGITFPIALDSSGSVANDYNIQYTNTHFLINKDGRLVRTIPGDISERDIQSLL